MSQSGTHLVSVEIPLELVRHLLEALKHGWFAGRIGETDKEVLIDALKDAIAQDDA